MNGLRYALREGWISVWRSGRSSLASIGTIAVAFLTLGAFVVASSNADRTLSRWSEAAEMSVYLDPSVTEAVRRDVEDWLGAQPGVASVEYLSADRALSRFRTDFPELNDVVTTLGANPFPASLEVRLATGAAMAQAADRVADSVKGRAGVADVRYDRRWLDRVRVIVTGGRLAGLAVAAVLMLGAAFTVAAVVRLSLDARAAELDIMRLVGAPATFLRGPFIVEGLLLGAIGAGMALLALSAAYASVMRWWGTDLSELLAPTTLAFLDRREEAFLIVAGLAVGAIAGLLASRSAD